MTDFATPSLVQLLKKAIRSALVDCHTALPGKIIRYDKDLQQADIQPMLKRKFLSTNKDVDAPTITNVPVWTMQAEAGNAFIAMPLKAGDLGLIIFSERSIDTYLSSDGDKTIAPNDPRLHSFSDALFIPGLVPFSKAVKGIDDKAIHAGYGDIDLKLYDNGTIQILNTANELISVLSELINNLITIPACAIPGFVNPALSAALGITKVKLDSFKK